MKRTLILGAALLIAGSLQAKKTLSHDDFDSWEKLANGPVSNNGKWASFMVMPQEGDQTLTFYNTSTGKKIVVPRGHMPSFTADSRYAVARIKPFYAATREAKIAKKKGFDLPQDSLAIIDLITQKVEKIGNVISYKIGKDGGNWVAWLSCDTTLISSKSLKNSKVGRPMILRSLTDGATKKINWVEDYVFSNDGTRLALNLKPADKDTLATAGTGVIILPDTSFHLIDRDKKYYGTPVFNENGTKVAYVASEDSVTSGTKRSDLYLASLTGSSFESGKVRLDIPEVRSGKLAVNQYSRPAFSYNGERLVVGVAPVVAPDDTTLVSFETPGLDIWRWDAPLTPPQANKNIDRLRKRTMPVVINLSDGKQVLMTDNMIDNVITPDRWDGNWAVIEDSKNIVQRQYDYQYPADLLLKNVLTGETKNIGEFANGTFSLSPADRFIIWFDGEKFHTYEIATGERRDISSGVQVALWDEDVDRPEKIKSDYGIMGWTKDDGRVLVYDRYDVWSLDPLGKADPVCITAGEGRKKNLRFRYERTERDHRFFELGEKVIYSVFNYDDMKNGLASAEFSLKPAAPKIDFYGEWEYTDVGHGKDSDVYSWIQANFSNSPNIYVT
ncbi:MAG: hypothetical protein K2M10_06645, partial [Muribaculaceae bacterium]|nr:hypothetical protein [Muribaculaceae bacterium]